MKKLILILGLMATVIACDNGKTTADGKDSITVDTVVDTVVVDTVVVDSVK